MAAGRALRGLLLEALRGCDDSVLERLGPFASWKALTTLWHAGWLGEGKTSARATCAQLRGRLREIAEARRSIAASAEVRAGTTTCFEGRITEATSDHLLVDDDSGETALVEIRGMRWLGAPHWPSAGERVTVLGFADLEVDPSRAAAGPRRLPRRVVIRGAGLPVIAHVGAVEIEGPAR